MSIYYCNKYSQRDMGRTDMGIDNYLSWLTPSATGLAVIFALLSASIFNGKG
jgi:hypothetical protein